MSTARKSDIKHPAAKRFMVVFVVVMLIGITVDSVHRSDVGDWIVATGVIGFLASALIASEKRSDTPNVPSNSTKTTSSNVMAEARGCLVLLLFVAVIGAFLWFVLPDSWTDKIRYSAEYSIETSQVERHDPPTDCDFMTAPLGKKNCHYKKTVAAYNAQNLQVAGDDAPRYGSDTSTHRPMISYDNGKTWDWLPEEIKTVNLRVTKVIVDWVKVSGE